jgi:hypothetical protein
MIKEAIDKILEMRDVKKIKSEDGREYFTHGTFPQHPEIPRTIVVHTLDGLVDMVKDEKLTDCSAYIENHLTVTLQSSRNPLWQTRKCFAKASTKECTFNFGLSMSIERFIVQLQCHFVDSPVKKKIIDLLANITTSEVVTAEDDGIVQNVTAKNKVGHRIEAVKLDPIVELRPYRTFRELEQPIDNFLLRMTTGEPGRLPTVALHSAGGDLWQHVAINSIYEYLKKHLPKENAVIR